MIRILFQGDYITDSERSRENLSDMGAGYPALVKSTLGTDEPGAYEFVNRGVGKSRVTDLYARVKEDFINLNPDYLSILIGVNDVWHEIIKQDGVENEKFFRIYSMLIEEIMKALPQVKIMIMEPYVLKASATEEKWKEFDAEVKKRAKMAKAVAEKYHLKFVP